MTSRFRTALVPAAAWALPLCAALAGCGLVPGESPGGGDADCVPGTVECLDDSRLRSCIVRGTWMIYECPTTYEQLPDGCTWDSVEHGCEDGACWLDCEDPGGCGANGPCMSDTSAWLCIDQHMGLELWDCADYFASYGDQSCACGAWCVEWQPGNGGCRCDCEGDCADHAPGDPGCDCCWSDAGVDAGPPDPDAGVDAGVDAGG